MLDFFNKNYDSIEDFDGFNSVVANKNVILSVEEVYRISSPNTSSYTFFVSSSNKTQIISMSLSFT